MQPRRISRTPDKSMRKSVSRSSIHRFQSPLPSLASFSVCTNCKNSFCVCSDHCPISSLTKNHFLRGLEIDFKKKLAAQSNFILKTHPQAYISLNDLKQNSRSFWNPMSKSKQTSGIPEFFTQNVKEKVLKVGIKYLNANMNNYKATHLINFLYDLILQKKSRNDRASLKRKLEEIASFMALHNEELKLEQSLLGMPKGLSPDKQDKLLVTRFHKFLETLRELYGSNINLVI